MKGESWFEEIRRIQEDFDRLISKFFSLGSLATREMLPDYSQNLPREPFVRTPLTDIIEKDNEIIAKVEMPGINKEDIEINAREDGIEIKAQTSEKIEKADKEKGWHRIERRYTGFHRYISLPKEADIEKIDATYKNGILELHIPLKKSKQKKGKKIKVK